VSFKRAWRARFKIARNPAILTRYLAKTTRKYLTRSLLWPSIVYIGVNNRCNYFCEFCDIGRANLERKRVHSDFVYNLWTSEMASFETWKAVIDDVSKFKPVIAVTTAEPLLYDRLFDLVDYVHSKGMEIWVTTNGYLLPTYAERMLEQQLDRLQVSIDGPPEIHDKIRGVNGAFQRAMSGIESIMSRRSARKPYVSINYTIGDLNYDRLVETLNLVRCDEMTFTHLNFVTDDMANEQNRITPFRATSTSISRVQLDMIDLDILHDQCVQLRSGKWEPIVSIVPDLDREGLTVHYRRPLEPHKHMRTCNAMTKVGQILADGSVTVSTRCLSTIRLGKVTERSFSEIWHGEEFEKFRLYMRAAKLMPACMRCCGAL